jgi:cytochrome c oxidase assembly factor CtaG/putative copper export protein
VSKTLVLRSSVIALAPLVAVGTLAVLFGLNFGGGAAPLELIDPGAGVRWGLPLSMFVLRIASSLMLGALLVQAFAIPLRHPVSEKLSTIASGAAVVWVVASAVTAFFTFLAVYVEPVSFDDRFGRLLTFFFAQTEIGQAWLWSTLLAGVASVVVIVARSYPALFVTGLLGVMALWPLAEQGHAAGTEAHNQAVMASFLHSVFVAFWIGGLAALAMVWRMVSSDRAFLSSTLTRYSSIALVSAVVVGASGSMNAWVRVGDVSGLASTYGVLVMVKMVLLTILIGFGVAYRAWLIRRFTDNTDRSSQKALGGVFVGELAIMGTAVGMAVALSRTPTPTPDVPALDRFGATPAEILTGKPLPPEYDWTKLFTVWEIDLLWGLIGIFTIVFYLQGAIRLAKRGDKWPIGRTISFVSGMLLLIFSTSSGMAVYGMYLFSVHMMGHMLLSMAIPVLLVLGGPITLAARAIAVRSDGSWGTREWVMNTVHSKYVETIGHPLIAAPLFAFSLIVFYYSPIFEWALADHLGHHWMVFHFVASGYIFAQMLVGVDPQPHRPVYPIRLIVVLATMAFHAFFGLSLIMGTGLLAPEWYGAMGREWGADPLSDQQTGGEIAWSLGEIPTLALAVLIAIGWSREGDRESKRLDRQADRDDDKALREYNDMLQARAEADKRPSRR